MGSAINNVSVENFGFWAKLSDYHSWDGNIHWRPSKFMPSLFIWMHRLLQAIEITQSRSTHPRHHSNHMHPYMDTQVLHLHILRQTQ